ncbi:MAG TPA: ATP-binding protein [Amnibacterium sp.]|nr:ATP-binding protein [Amnibacterium sp.]
MTTHPPLLGRVRPSIPPRRSTPAARWAGPVLWTAAAVVCGVGLTAMATLTDWFPRGARAGSIGTEVNTVDAAVALLVAYLSHGRFVREHRMRHRLIAHGLGVIGSASLLVPPGTMLLRLDAGGTPVLWATAVLRLVGTGFIVAGALCGDLRVVRTPIRGVGLLVPVALTAGVLAAVSVADRSLPPAIVPIDAGDGGPLGFVSHPLFGAMQLVSAIGFLAAAVLLTRLVTRHPHDPSGLKGPAFALGAFAFFQYALYPTLATDWIYTGDVLRTGCYALLLLGAVLEIRRYWTGQSRIAVLADRRRLAREIHDGVVQEVSYIRMESRSLPQHLGVDRIVDACDRALDEARDAVHALALAEHEPLDHLLERAAHDLSRRYGIEVPLRLEGDPACDADQRHGLVRIAREAIANAVRHGRAHVVTVALRRSEPGWTLEIQDDGVGFDAAAVGATAGGYGLISMRERADALPGRCVVETEPGRGTTVRVMW